MVTKRTLYWNATDRVLFIDGGLDSNNNRYDATRGIETEMPTIRLIMMADLVLINASVSSDKLLYRPYKVRASKFERSPFLQQMVNEYPSAKFTKLPSLSRTISDSSKGLFDQEDIFEISDAVDVVMFKLQTLSQTEVL